MSPTRRFRLARTAAIVTALAVLTAVWASQCDSGEPSATDSSTTAPATTDGGVTSATSTAPSSGAPLGVRTLPQRLPAPHMQTGAAALGRNLYVLGGLDKARASTDVVWRIDPSTGETTSVGRLPKVLHDAAVAAVGRDVMAFGGGEGNAQYREVHAVRDGRGDATTVGSMPTKRSDAVALTVDNGARALVIGGFDGSGPTNDVLATSDGVTFTPLSTLAEPVRYPAVAVSGTTVWILGGTWKDQSTASIQALDLTTGVTQLVGKLEVPRSHAMAFTLGGTVYLAGGLNATGRLQDVVRFDPATRTTTPAARLPQPLSDAGVAVVGGTAYLVGGATPAATDRIVALSPS